MKSLASLRIRLFRPATVALVSGVLSLSSVSRVHATDPVPLPPLVEYAPTAVQIEGQLPFSRDYTFTLKSPNNVAPGGSIPISWVVTTNSIPAGAVDATAIGYISLSPAKPNFSDPNQVQTVTVSITMPASAVVGSYAYKVLAVGWPNPPTPNFPSGELVNVGTFINATVTAQPALLTPPTVSINTPVDASIISVPVGGFPINRPLQYSASSTGAGSSVITGAVAELSGPTGSTLTLQPVANLNTVSVTGAGTLVIAQPGTYSVTARATNTGGTATDVNTINVVFSTPPPPPTVAINTPAPGSSYTYRVGGAAFFVPVTFTAKSNFGGIRSLSAKVDNVDVTSQIISSEIGRLTATGTINLSSTTAGAHTLQVIATDDYGSATADSSFNIVVVAPTPSLTIASPTTATLTLPAGQTTLTVPFTINSTSNNGFFVDSVVASFDSGSSFSPATTGIGTASGVSTGNLTNVGAGTHTLTATVYSGGTARVSTTTSVSFRVQSTAVLPTVVINTPPLGSIYTRVSDGPALSIPLTFTGTSNAPYGAITQLKASLSGTALSVSSTTLGQKTANGSAMMSVMAEGTYTISVTATDAAGTASTTRTFRVNVVCGKNICGRVFFDLNFNGVFDRDIDDRRCSGNDWNDSRGSRNERYGDRGDCRDSGDRYFSRDNDGDDDCEEFGLGGITVKLLNASGAVVAMQVTDSSGNYCFANVAPGVYTVSVVIPPGYGATTTSRRAVTVGTANVCVRDIGLGLKFTDLDNLCAQGKTSNYWKTQIDKCIKGERSAEVSSSTCNSHTKTIGSLALPLFDGITVKTASSTLGSGSGAARDCLSKQLLAAEYNYANGAYINGNKTLTYCFIQWGERVHTSASSYSNAYAKWAADWFEAYNTSGGGRLDGPR